VELTPKKGRTSREIGRKGGWSSPKGLSRTKGDEIRVPSDLLQETPAESNAENETTKEEVGKRCGKELSSLFGITRGGEG